MIPVIFLNSDIRYTIVTKSQIVSGIVTGSAIGVISLSDADVYDISMEFRIHADDIQINYTDIVSAGFCTDSRYTLRNELCFQLNNLSVKNF